MSNATEPRRGRGRPRSVNPRSEAFLLRLKPEELETISRKAKRAGKVRAEWIRHALLTAA